MITSPEFLQQACNIKKDPLLETYIAIKSDADMVTLRIAPNDNYYIRYRSNGKYVKEQYPEETVTLYVDADPNTEIRLYGTTFVDFGADDNQIVEFYVGNQDKLAGVSIINNKLETLDIINLESLVMLYVSGNNLQSLDVSGLTKLQTLYCNNCKLLSLYVQGCESLQDLQCSANHLTDLNLEEQIYSLGHLDAHQNSIGGTLDFGVFPGLEFLDLSNTMLEGLVPPVNLSGELKIVLYGTFLVNDVEKSNEFVKSLPTVPTGSTTYSLVINGLQSETIKTGAEAKNWKVTIHE